MRTSAAHLTSEAQERKRRSQEICERLNARLKDASADLEAFRKLAGGYFAEVAAVHDYQRRPSLAIRLAIPGDPPARLIMAPGWNRREHFLMSYSPMLSLSVARPGEDNELQRHVHLAVRYGGWGWVASRWQIGPSSDADFDRLLAGVQQFVATPWGAFCQSASRCCICWKVLKDELSRARGIGPECYRGVAAFFGPSPPRADRDLFGSLHAGVGTERRRPEA
jgi:hypothetical protein